MLRSGLSRGGSLRVERHDRRWGDEPQRGAIRARSGCGYRPLERGLRERRVSVLRRPLLGRVRLAPVLAGLLERKLRAHLRDLGDVHAGLLQRSLPDVLWQRRLRRRLLERRMQHVLPDRRDLQRQLLVGRVSHRVRGGVYLYHRLLERPLHGAVRLGRKLLVYELLQRFVPVHGRGVPALSRE